MTQELIVGHATTPRISAYPWSDSSGFGSKFSDPATLPSSVNAVAATATAVAVGGGGTTLTAYPFSASGFGVKYANPSVLPGAVNGLRFDPTGNYVGVASGTSPRIHIYAWSSSSGLPQTWQCSRYLAV